MQGSKASSRRRSARGGPRPAALPLRRAAKPGRAQLVGSALDFGSHHTSTTEPNPGRLALRERRFRPLGDQPPFELREHRHDPGHGLAARRGQVSGRIERHESPAFALRLLHDHGESTRLRESRSILATTSVSASPRLSRASASEMPGRFIDRAE